MRKKAAIYVRVSSERQAKEDRVSIESQLAECEEYCEKRGYFIVERFIDKEKYRVKKKLVQPSGQRKDRPAYQKMLKAARNDEFEVIVAWKEDRLYRGMYAAMPLSELLDEKRGSLDVDLVRETFDHKMLGIKAALGKIEVDNIRERMMMGRRARLERGEVPGGNQVKYGYQKVNKRLEIQEEETMVVQKIFEWYLAGDNNMVIRKRLNEMGIAPRRGKLWSKITIGKILTGEFYATGKLPTTLDGETFYIPCPPIISMQVWEKAKEVRKSNTKLARNVKRDYLCRGMVYCVCGWKCNVRTVHSNRYRGYQSYTGAYVCQRYYREPENRVSGCVPASGSKKIDDYVWNRVKKICNHPELIKKAIDKKLTQLQAEKANLEIDLNKLKGKLDGLSNERQWIITQARKGSITEEDMELQLGQIEVQEWAYRKELDEYKAVTAVRSQMQLLSEWAQRYLENIREGIKALDVEVDDLGEDDFKAMFQEFEAWRFAHKFRKSELAQLKWAILEEKRRIVRTIVKRVIVGRGKKGKKRKYDIELALDIPMAEFLGSSDQSLEYINAVGLEAD